MHDSNNDALVPAGNTVYPVKLHKGRIWYVAEPVKLMRNARVENTVAVETVGQLDGKVNRFRGNGAFRLYRFDTPIKGCIGFIYHTKYAHYRLEP